MAIATIPEAIERGDISTYLVGNANSRGMLFGGKIAAPGSQVSIAMVTDGLRWGYDGGAQTDESLRNVANYLIWLCGIYGQQAAVIAGGSGGGSVVPGGGSTSGIFPLYITQANFTSATFYPNTNIFGNNIIIFMNEINRYLIPNSEFTVDATGVTITLDGFNATLNTYNLVIERYTN